MNADEVLVLPGISGLQTQFTPPMSSYEDETGVKLIIIIIIIIIFKWQPLIQFAPRHCLDVRGIFTQCATLMKWRLGWALHPDWAS